MLQHTAAVLCVQAWVHSINSFHRWSLWKWISVKCVYSHLVFVWINFYSQVNVRFWQKQNVCGDVLRRQHIMLMCYALVVLESNAPQRQINNVNNELWRHATPPSSLKFTRLTCLYLNITDVLHNKLNVHLKFNKALIKVGTTHSSCALTKIPSSLSENDSCCCYVSRYDLLSGDTCSAKRREWVETTRSSSRSRWEKMSSVCLTGGWKQQDRCSSQQPARHAG